MVDVLTEDFITVKRATGLPWERVVRSHAVPNALLPLVTLSAIQFGAVVGGAITIETIFSWPGLGELSYDAINDKDFPVLAGDVPGLLRGGDPGQPARRLPVLLPRPAGAVEVSAEQASGPIIAVEHEPIARSATGPSGPPAGHLARALRVGGARPVDLRGDLRRADRPLRPGRVEPRRAGPTELRALARDDGERLRRLLPAPGRRAGLDRRRLRRRDRSRRCSARRSGSRAATSGAGPIASSTRSRTGSS